MMWGEEITGMNEAQRKNCLINAKRMIRSGHKDYLWPNIGLILGFIQADSSWERQCHKIYEPDHLLVDLTAEEANQEAGKQALQEMAALFRWTRNQYKTKEENKMTDTQNHTGTLQCRACEMRIMGQDYPTIADSLGTTPEDACKLVRMELDQRRALRDPETEYHLSVERFRRLLDALKEKAETGNEKAISLTIRIIELWESLKAEHAGQCTPKEWHLDRP